MRIARVIGKVTLNKRNPDLAPARYLLVRTCSRRTLAGLDAGNAETLVTYDDLGASAGDLIGLVEGREATAPFLPRRVAYDCYNACILEAVNFEPVLEDRQQATGNRQQEEEQQTKKGTGHLASGIRGPDTNAGGGGKGKRAKGGGASPESTPRVPNA